MPEVDIPEISTVCCAEFWNLRVQRADFGAQVPCVDIEPNATSLLIKALKEPIRDRKKVKNIKHNGNLPKVCLATKSKTVVACWWSVLFFTVIECVEATVLDIARQMRYKSQAKEFKGTVKEVLGSANSIGCTVDGMKPANVQKMIDEDEWDVPEK
eukprot:2982718-Amphidinium_carterae.1